MNLLMANWQSDYIEFSSFQNVIVRLQIHTVIVVVCVPCKQGTISEPVGMCHWFIIGTAPPECVFMCIYVN